MLAILLGSAVVAGALLGAAILTVWSAGGLVEHTDHFGFKNPAK